MASHVSASWDIPPLSWLNISDCDAIAPWVAYVVTTMADPGLGGAAMITTWETAIPVGVVLEFLRAVVPNNWTTPTNGDLLLWHMDLFTGYLQSDQGEIFADIIDFGLEGCGSKICPNLDFSGDSDLSGIGMMISFYMVAVFVTLYYLALVPWVFEAYGHEFRSSRAVSLYRKLASGFEESVAGFLDAMLLFAISMLVAAITRYASLVMKPHESHSLYGLQDCVFLSAFSTLPALILQSLSYDLRRRRIRLALWGLLIALTITVEVLYRREYLYWISDYEFLFVDVSTTQYSQIAWFGVCQSEGLRRSLQTLITVGHCFVLVNAVAWIYIIAAIRFGDRWARRFQFPTAISKGWETFKMCLRLGNGVLCLVTMWTSLGLFTVYRKDVMTKAGEADQDGAWTFGQVLSLTTWVPIGIELLSVYHYGAKKGVEGKLSRRYKVVERTDTRFHRDQVAYKKTPGVEATRLDDVADERA